MNVEECTSAYLIPTVKKRATSICSDVSSVTSNTKRSKTCSFCKNHGLEVPEKGHRNCDWKGKCDCKKCKFSLRKIYNAKKFRMDQKSSTDYGVSSTVQCYNDVISDNSIVHVEEVISSQDYAEVFNQDPIYTEQHLILEDIEALDILDEFVSSQNITVENGDTYLNCNDFETITYTYSPQELQPTIQNEYSKSSEAKDLSVIILPENYPSNICDEKSEKIIKNRILKAIDQSEGVAPRFQYNIFENGYMKIVCLDQSSCDWLQNEVKKWVNLEIPMKAITENELEKHINMTCKLDTEIQHEEFIRFVKIQNGIESSRWHVINITKVDEEFRVDFIVDPLSYREISLNGFKLSIGLQTVDVKFMRSANIIQDAYNNS